MIVKFIIKQSRQARDVYYIKLPGFSMSLKRQHSKKDNFVSSNAGGVGKRYG